METYRKSEFSRQGITEDFLQDNHSYSVGKGVLRGLHFQKQPCAQGKLVRCVVGEIFDVVRLMMLLEESGERRQGELVSLLGVETYELSRLLSKLETAHWVTRRRDGNDKIVSCFRREPALMAATAK
jgi:hypothetical protein